MPSIGDFQVSCWSGLLQAAKSSPKGKKSATTRPGKAFSTYMICFILCFAWPVQSVDYEQASLNDDVNIPSVTAGTISYIPGLKRTGSTFPGTFVYVQHVNGDDTNHVRFFDSVKTSSFYHNYHLELDLGGTYGGGTSLYLNPDQLHFNYTKPNTVCCVKMPIGYSAGQFYFTSSTERVCGAGGYSYMLQSDDRETRQVWILPNDNKVRFTQYVPTLWKYQAEKPWTVGDAKYEFIHSVIKIGVYALYIERRGTIYWDDEGIVDSVVSSQVVSDFQPKYALADRSRTCDTTNCDVIILEERDSNVLKLSILQVKIGLAGASLKFAGLDVTAFATLNMPINIPKTRSVVLLGPTGFNMFNIFEDKIVPAGISTVGVPAVQPNSLMVGDFDQTAYPGEYPCMVMEIDAANFKPKMYVIKSTRCKTKNGAGDCTECQPSFGLNPMQQCDACNWENCLTQGADCSCDVCQPGYRKNGKICEACSIVGCQTCNSNKATCETCLTGKVSHNNQCITCRTSAPDAIVVEFGVAKCVQTFVGTGYSDGYRKDPTITAFIFLEACTVSNCKACTGTTDVCTMCKTGALLHLNKCTTCGAIAPAALVVLSGVPTCVSTSGPGPYAEGYRIDSTVTAFVLIEPCTANCIACPTSASICGECKLGTIPYLGKCTTCGTTSPAAIVVESGIPKCVDTSPTSLYSEGYRKSSSITEFVLLEACSVVNCKTCPTILETCTSCKVGSIFYSNQCIKCNTVAPAALLIETDTPKCIDMGFSPYNEGYGPDTSVTEYVLAKPCNTANCKKCSPNFMVCVECKSEFTLAETLCNKSSTSGNTGGQGTTQAKPGQVVKVFASIATNSYGVVFQPNQSRALEMIQVRDTQSRTTYTCSQVGCTHIWRDSLLSIQFKSPITITKGEIIITRKQTRSQSGTTTLDESDILISDISVMKIISDNGWITATQVLLFLMRILGSLLLFKRYPHLSMVPDKFITMCFILCMFLGPVMYTADSALEMAGQIKIPWFRMSNLADGWDTQTQAIPPSPNTWKFLVFASFLDNYSQNVVGLASLCFLLALAQILACKLLPKVNNTGMWHNMCRILQDNFTVQYMLAKIDANSLEFLMYCLICFDKADASSKSIIGIVLAVGFLGVQLWLALGAVFEIFHGMEAGRKYGEPENGGSTAMITVYDMGAPVSNPNQATSSNKHNRSVLQILTSGFRWLPKTYTQEQPVWPKFLVPAHFLRNMVLCILALKLLSSPAAQLALASVFQAVYLGYYLYCSVHFMKPDFWGSLSVEASLLAILIFRAISTSPSLSESGLQDVLASFILGALALTLLVVFGTSGFAIYTFFKKVPQLSQSQQPENKFSIRMVEQEDVPENPIEQPKNPKHLTEVDEQFEFSIAEENIGRVSSELVEKPVPRLTLNPEQN